MKKARAAAPVRLVSRRRRSPPPAWRTGCRPSCFPAERKKASQGLPFLSRGLGFGCRHPKPSPRLKKGNPWLAFFRSAGKQDGRQPVRQAGGGLRRRRDTKRTGAAARAFFIGPVEPAGHLD